MNIKVLFFAVLPLWLGSCLFSCTNSPTKKKEQTTEAISDDSLLTLVQHQTFRYFWEGAEPNSGMARERFHVDGVYPENDQQVVTTGGSGFGLMAILVGIERGFVTRGEAADRFLKIVEFLEKADRFHGAWPHWLDGETGKVKPFSPKDDGGDLVETAFLVQGLLAVKQYFLNGNDQEQELVRRIDKLWREVEWDWYQKGEKVLYWHWSPNYDWAMNFPVEGYNECLVMYILGAASPTHPITPDAYHQGWARSGAIRGNHEKYGYVLELNHNGALEEGGPLFWSHYSFLGLDPRHLKDAYADYWRHNVAHVMIDRQHCIENPHGYKGYGENCWGLTSCYTVKGAVSYFEGKTDLPPVTEKYPTQVDYAGHRPGFDLGVIAPTAAISSIPYAPKEVMKVIRFFYEELGADLWGPYGFYDAFSIHYNWFPKKYLAIDQGPVVVMIENYRTGLLWNLFMKDQDVQRGLNVLGFTVNQ